LACELPIPNYVKYQFVDVLLIWTAMIVSVLPNKGAATGKRPPKNGIGLLQFLWIALLVATLNCFVVGQQPSPIRDLVMTGMLEGIRWPNFTNYQTLLLQFYEPTVYAPAWVQGCTTHIAGCGR
jgi:hypothetical protein